MTRNSKIINRKGIRKPSSGFTGVYNRKNTSYEAHFAFGGTKVHLGTYNSPEAAYLARIKYIDSLK